MSESTPAQRTPGPLAVERIHGDPQTFSHLIYGKDGDGIARVLRITDNPDAADANAQHIALCWNSHDALLAACKATVDLFEAWRDGIFRKIGVTWSEEPPAIVVARAAIADAEAIPNSRRM